MFAKSYLERMKAGSANAIIHKLEVDLLDKEKLLADAASKGDDKKVSSLKGQITKIHKKILDLQVDYLK